MKVKFGDLKLKNGKTIAEAMRACISYTGCSICKYNQMVECGFIFNTDVCDDKIELDDVLNYEVEVSKDPTETAIEAVKQSDNKKVYICSPYRGDTKKDTKKNVAAAIEYCRYAIDRGVIPIAPHIYLTQFLNDDMRDVFTVGFINPMRVNLNNLSAYAADLLTGLNASEEAAFFDAGGQMEIKEPEAESEAEA